MDRNSHLLVESGVCKGSSYTVPPKGARLGRSSKNDFRIDDKNLSRHHSEFIFKEGKLWIRDLGSANETLLNDRPVEEAQLKKGDRITLGESQILVLMSTVIPNLRLQKDLLPPDPPPQLKLDRTSRGVRILAIPLWILLLAWFTFLGYSVLREKADTPTGDSPKAEVASRHLEAAKGSPTSVGPAPRPGADPTQASRPRSATSAPDTPVVASRQRGRSTPRRPREASEPTATGADALSPTEQTAIPQNAEFQALARATVFKIMKKEYLSAQEGLLEELSATRVASQREQINQLSAMVSAASKIEQRVSAALADQLGETVTFTSKDRPITMRLIAITGNTVKGSIQADGGSKVVNFRVGNLPALGQSRILGDPVSPEDHFVKCLLMIRGKDYDAAALYAPNCGVLRPVLSSMLNTLRQ